MSDTREIVDKIRTILYSDVDPDMGGLEQLKNAYVAAIQQVNKELRDCDQLLHQGLRDQAIQKCNATKLLDRVSALDFPEQSEWASYIMACGMPAPPTIEIERASDLNEAFDKQQPLDPLMRMHRLHALARSPLPVRIAIMRRIEQKDRENPVWGQAIQDFERARHGQLAAEVAGAIKRRDLKSLATLEQELRSPDWALKPAKTLVKQAVDGHTQLRQSQAKHELQRLQTDLNAAYADFDLAKGRRVRSRWNALATIAALGDGDAALLDLVAPALEWLAQADASEAEQADYSRSLASLRQALTDWAPYETLKSHAETVARFPDGIPELEQTQLMERFAYLQARENAMKRWKTVGALAAAVLLAGLTGVGIFLHLQAQDLDQTVASLTALIEAENVDGATEFLATLEQQDSVKFNNPRIQELRQTLSAAVTEEEARRQRFSGLVKEVEETGLDAPDWDDFPQAREILTRAKDVAKTDDEILTLNQLGSRLKDVERAKLKAQEDAYLAASQGLQQQYEAYKANSTGNADDLQRLAAAYAELSRWDHVDEAIKRTDAALLQRIRSETAELQRMKDQDQLLAEVTRTVGNRAHFFARLKAVLGHPAFEGNRQLTDFQQVIEREASIGEGVEAWTKFSRDMAALNLTTVAPQRAADLIEQCNTMLSTYPDHPATEQVSQLVAFLTPVAGRGSTAQRSDAAVRLALTEESIARTFYVRTKDGKWYYSKREPTSMENGGAWTIQYFANLNLDTKGAIVRSSEIVNSRSGTSFQFESPQAAFSREAIKLFDAVGNDNWEHNYLEMLESLVQREDMDPIFTYYLLTGIVPAARQGSLPLERALTRYAELLSSGTVNVLENYLDPTEPHAAEVRLAAHDVLQQLPPLENARKQVAEDLAQMVRPQVGEQYDWVGWLRVGANGSWVCDLTTSRAELGKSAGVLVVVHPDPAGKLHIDRIGELSAGKVTLAQSATAAFVAGRPVYLTATKSQ